ncbi:11646_t:CDS:2 [Acaulospora colombiana]|uniref:11646_t:CDS:1 n=1 Tax=Acaulospora colombiana TaxID=27376 RepID=A0ACA9L8F1_9GLOM|nr:11646_t:CDS:2 [Acaulospora colombiana]
MATKRVSTREELQNMSRADLQKLAKVADRECGAMPFQSEQSKTRLFIIVVTALIIHSPFKNSVRLAYVPPRLPPSSVRNERTGAQRNPDEQENLPTPKLTPTASSADRESVARLKGKDHIKSSAGKSRIPVPGGGRKVSGVRALLPPAVVAAHPLPPPSESPSKTRGKVKKAEKIMEKETTSPIRPYADEDHDMEGNPGNATPTDSLPSAGSTSQNPGPTLPASSLTSLLERRIVKLEKSSADNQSTRQQDMSYLLAQLKEAQDDIVDLKQQNEDLKKRLDSEVATKKEMSDIINRLAELDDQLARMNIRPDPSVTSSEAELPYEAPMPPRKLEYQTPPSQIGLLVGRMSNPSLAPAARIHPSASRRDRKERARHTPPPQPRRYPLNPDESPSPQRRSSAASTSLLPISGSVKRGSSAMGTPPTSSPRLANSRNASPIAERSQKRQLLRDKRYSMMEEEMDGYQSDTPPRELNPVQTLAPIESQGDSEVTLSPRPPLPFPIVASPSAAPVEIEMDSQSRKPSSSRRRSPAKFTRGRRAHPYDVQKTRESASPEAGPSSLPDGERSVPNMKIPWFGETPDPSRAPGPSSFPGGFIPKLSLARSSLSGSAAMLMHDPIETPEYEEPRQVEETPPASRTRYGTEFRSTLKAKFSDSAPAWR